MNPEVIVVYWLSLLFQLLLLPGQYLLFLHFQMHRLVLYNWQLVYQHAFALWKVNRQFLFRIALLLFPDFEVFDLIRQCRLRLPQTAVSNYHSQVMPVISHCRLRNHIIWI